MTNQDGQGNDYNELNLVPIEQIGAELVQSEQTTLLQKSDKDWSDSAWANIDDSPEPDIIEASVVAPNGNTISTGPITIWGDTLELMLIGVDRSQSIISDGHLPDLIPSLNDTIQAFGDSTMNTDLALVVAGFNQDINIIRPAMQVDSSNKWNHKPITEDELNVYGYTALYDVIILLTELAEAVKAKVKKLDGIDNFTVTIGIITDGHNMNGNINNQNRFLAAWKDAKPVPTALIALKTRANDKLAKAMNLQFPYYLVIGETDDVPSTVKGTLLKASEKSKENPLK